MDTTTNNLRSLTADTLADVARACAEEEIDERMADVDRETRESLAAGFVTDDGGFDDDAFEDAAKTRVAEARARCLAQFARDGVSEGWINAGADREVPAKLRKRFVAALDAAAKDYAASLT